MSIEDGCFLGRALRGADLTDLTAPQRAAKLRGPMFDRPEGGWTGSPTTTSPETTHA